MKTNAYTTAIQRIHAPSSTVEKALQNAKERDFDRAEEVNRRPFPIKRVAIAAVIVLTMIGAIAVYGIFVAPTSQICLDSRESVTVTLNSRGKVLSADRYSTLVGKTAEKAIETIVKEMIDDGMLSKDENTLIVGISGNGTISPDLAAKCVNDAYEDSGFDGCTIAMSIHKDFEAKRQKSMARACIINLLNTYEPSLSVENLSDLSVNELGLLLVKTIHNNDIVVTGAPSESAYIGFDGAVDKALMLSGFRENELSDMSAAYSIYHGKLIYLVRLNAGENSEVYFINALTGATEQAIKAPATDINKAVEEANQMPPKQEPTETPTYSEVVPTIMPVTQSPTVPVTEKKIDSNQPPFEDPTNAPKFTEPTVAPNYNPTTAPIIPTQAPTTAEYPCISITLKELSFVVLSPPQSAVAVGYQTLFEGQYVDARKGDKINSGEVAVITDYNQFLAFLKKNPYAFTDKNGSPLMNTYTAEYFKTHFILASACTVSDASYYTTVTELSSDGGMIYMENSLSYGPAHSGVFYCHTLSLYGVSRSAGIPKNLTVY